MFKEIAPDIFDISTDDTDLDLFENQYPLTDGVSYNSYVISSGGVTAVVDSVDARRGDQWLEMVKAAAPKGVDYLIVQHMEPDHSASIELFCRAYPEAKVIATQQALKIIGQFFPDLDLSARSVAVKDGETIEIGSHTLSFHTAAMVHWPEVMVTYDSTTGTLFSADAFGTFGTADSFPTLWPEEARRYYANIVGKYGPQVQRALKKLAGVGNISLVAPLHGPKLAGTDIAEALRLYDLWSSYMPESPEGVLVAYASIYGNTARVALSVADRLKARGREVTTIDLCRQDVSYAVGQAFRFGRIVVAAPTYDAGVFPAMHDFLYHLQIKGLRARRFGIIENGSWAPTAGKVMRSMIEQMPDMTVADTMVTLKSAPDSTTGDALNRLCDEL